MNYTSPAIGAAHLSRKSVESVLPIYVRGVTNAHQVPIKCPSSVCQVLVFQTPCPSILTHGELVDTPN